MVDAHVVKWLSLFDFELLLSHDLRVLSDVWHTWNRSENLDRRCETLVRA